MESRRSSSFSRLMTRGEFFAIFPASSNVTASSSSRGTAWLTMPRANKRSTPNGWAVNSISLHSGMPPVLRKFWIPEML